jgi:hypothetical protein
MAAPQKFIACLGQAGMAVKGVTARGYLLALSSRIVFFPSALGW